MKIKRCENCVHWTSGASSPAGFGACAQIEDSNDTRVLSDTTRVYTWDYEGYRSGAYVGKDYCCIHFERRVK
jgi:hypothetical protein